jgi:hypothetical protein
MIGVTFSSVPCMSRSFPQTEVRNFNMIVPGDSFNRDRRRKTAACPSWIWVAEEINRALQQRRPRHRSPLDRGPCVARRRGTPCRCQARQQRWAAARAPSRCLHLTLWMKMSVSLEHRHLLLLGLRLGLASAAKTRMATMLWAAQRQLQPRQPGRHCHARLCRPPAAATGRRLRLACLEKHLRQPALAAARRPARRCWVEQVCLFVCPPPCLRST